MTCILGLDIGTTSAKAVLFDLNGKVLSESEKPYPILHPEAGWAEQDPAQIEKATIEAIRETVYEHSDNLIGIGFSTAMHSLIAMNQNGQPLSNAIIWADKRSSDESPEISSSIYLNTGTPLHPMSPLAKLKWLNKYEVEYYQKPIFCFSKRVLDLSLVW